MGFFANKSSKLLQQQVDELKQREREYKAQMMAIQNRMVFPSLNNFNYPGWEANHSQEAFCKSDQIYSVINKIAETTALIPGYVYEVKPDATTRQLKAATARQFYSTKALLDIFVLQRKSLDELPETDWYTKLLAKPNPYQNQTEFNTMGYLYYLLCGESIGYKVRLEQGANGGKTYQIYWLPPWMVTLELSSTFPREIVSYTFRINGIAVLDKVPATEFIHIRKTNPTITNTGDEFRGLSPLEPFGLQRKVMESMDLRVGAQVENGNLEGVIYDKAITYDETSQPELDAKRSAIYEFQRNKRNQGIPYYAAGELGFIATGLKLADMEVQGLIKISFKRLCNVYKISDILFNSDVAATESNVIEQIKQMYTNACLPLAYTFRDAYNTQLLNESSDKTRFFDVDISTITELQDDMAKLATALSAIPGGITLNEIRAFFKFDELDFDYMNKPIIKQGYALAETLELDEPLLTDPNVSLSMRV